MAGSAGTAAYDVDVPKVLPIRHVVLASAALAAVAGSNATPAGVAPATGRAVTTADRVADGTSLRGTLSWAPPHLDQPTRITVTSGRDPAKLNLSPRRDYILRLPPQGIYGTLEIDGGHNVALTGGRITVPSSANQDDNGADDTDTALYVRGSTGTVHIEGVLITADPDVMFDGIDVNAPKATVDIENVRIDDVYGSRTREHADVIQTWGGARQLRIDHLSADGDYQGLTIAPDLGRVGSADIRNVDLTLDPRPATLAPATAGGGYMIWLTRGTTTCDATRTAFSNVFIEDRSALVGPANTAWPPSHAGLDCGSAVARDRLSWRNLPTTGSVTLGAPPNGPFVPQGVAGNGYESPGYAAGLTTQVTRRSRRSLLGPR